MDSNHTKILVCPKCGADVSNIIYGDKDNNLCPYCGHEVYDYSVEKNQEKIEHVKEARRTILGIPRVVAITIIITLLVLFAGTALFYVLHLDVAVGNHALTAQGDKYTRKMANCYEKKDWDGLYDIVILDCEHSINSSSYFTYRTAWFMSYYPQEFDEAYASGDTGRMEEIYSYIKDDYMIRQQDFFYSMYDTIDEIEDELFREYDRESEIMKGLEDK